MGKSDTERSLQELVSSVKRHYGDRLAGLYRIDRRRDLEEFDQADAEIVVVLADASGTLLDQMDELSVLTFDNLLEWEVYIRAWPVTLPDWSDPSVSARPGLIKEFKQLAGPIEVAA